LPKQAPKIKEEAVKNVRENGAAVEIATEETEVEEIEEIEGVPLRTTTASGATSLVTGLQTVPRKKTAVALAESATETVKKVDALNAEEGVTSNVTVGDDQLAHQDHTTRAIDGIEDHVAEADLQAELQNDTDAGEMTEDEDPILQTAAATIDTIDVVEEEEGVLSNGGAESTTVEVLAADLFLILVRVPPDHLQGKKQLADKGNTPKVAATAEVKASTVRANTTTRGLIPRSAKNSRAMVNSKTTLKTAT
jgi:hypothetical protein